MAINNSINNAMFNIMRETSKNINNVETPKTPCPRCGSMMRLNQLGQDGRMAQWHCTRCKFAQTMRMQ